MVCVQSICLLPGRPPWRVRFHHVMSQLGQVKSASLKKLRQFARDLHAALSFVGHFKSRHSAGRCMVSSKGAESHREAVTLHSRHEQRHLKLPDGPWQQVPLGSALLCHSGPYLLLVPALLTHLRRHLSRQRELSDSLILGSWRDGRIAFGQGLDFRFLCHPPYGTRLVGRAVRLSISIRV